LGALFLQNGYGLSDPMTEEMIHNRISFRTFLDIKEDDTIPDETTICTFRNLLIKQNLLESLFFLVKVTMQQEGLILKEGTLVDATLIHTPEPKFTDEKDEAGRTKKKASHPEASYLSKRGAKHHGYKIHTATDRRGIITGVKGTTASVHDSQACDEPTEQEKKAVFGDSASIRQERKRNLRAKGIFCGIMERRVRGQSKLRSKTA
jgi:transposase, IS5 family